MTSSNATSKTVAELSFDSVRMETIACFLCGEDNNTELLRAQDDYTGKPGEFRFVTCNRCSLVFQNPRFTVEDIKAWYDDEYISHRKKTDWGVLTWFYKWAMDKHDRDKEKLVCRFVQLSPASNVLDVGCGSASFLNRLHERIGCKVYGVDFKDLSHLPTYRAVDFHCGLFYEQDLPENHFDLITMWHFLEHDYDPVRTLERALRLLKPEGRLILEVPRLDSNTYRIFGSRWPGLQAPQHTALYTKKTFCEMLTKGGAKIENYLPYGAFPAYFYLFAGAAFCYLRGRGLNLSKAIYPYFLGQMLTAPVMLCERSLNLAMQTAVCRKPT
jgi:SAM-dependent methyltransferase